LRCSVEARRNLNPNGLLFAHVLCKLVENLIDVVYRQGTFNDWWSLADHLV
jgi:hypothetical protein